MQSLEAKIYLVGGAVRDELLGLPVNERDWVVVGSSIEEMLAAGFRQADPDFPVFLHPETGEEYALARRELKTSAGYRGFVVDASSDVTLEEDLRRRDLTVNAMARDAEGVLIDPFGGRRDLEQGRLRHITPAFAEDPLRLLRVARFAAKLGGCEFRLAHDTHQLMKQMVADGAVGELLPQRTGREMHKALTCEQPWRFFEVLQACGALTELAPGLAMTLSSGHVSRQVAGPLKALQRVSIVSAEGALRFAALFLQTDDSPGHLEGWLDPGSEALELLGMAREAFARLQAGVEPDAVFELLQRLRAWHRGGRYEKVLTVIRAQPGWTQAADRLDKMREAALAVTSEDLTAQGYQGAELGREIARARVQAIAEAAAQSQAEG